MEAGYAVSGAGVHVRAVAIDSLVSSPGRRILRHQTAITHAGDVFTPLENYKDRASGVTWQQNAQIVYNLANSLAKQAGVPYNNAAGSPGNVAIPP